MQTFEDRKTDPEISYKEVRNKAQELERVIATLEGGRSRGFTRIMNRYKKIAKLIKVLNFEKNKINKDLKKRFDEIFDAEDQVVTRVIQTATVIQTLAKQETKHQTHFNVDGFIEQLIKDFPELEEAIQTLIKAYTTTNTIDPSPKLLEPKFVDPAKNESVYFHFKEAKTENMMSKLEQYLNLAAKKARLYSDKFGKTLQRIDDKLYRIGGDLETQIAKKSDNTDLDDF